MFNKGTLGDETVKSRGGDEEVVFPFDLADSRSSRGVRYSKGEDVGVFIEESLDQ